MNKNLFLEPEVLFEIQKILKAHLPKDAAVWVFGSRATGKIKRFSDVDIAIDLNHKLSSALLADLTEAFDASDIPYKVDIVDWHNISNAFKERIEPYKNTMRIQYAC